MRLLRFTSLVQDLCGAYGLATNLSAGQVENRSDMMLTTTTTEITVTIDHDSSKKTHIDMLNPPQVVSGMALYGPRLSMIVQTYAHTHTLLCTLTNIRIQDFETQTNKHTTSFNTYSQSKQPPDEACRE